MACAAPAGPPGPWRLLGRVVLVVLSVAWVAAMVWLRPFAAVQPALAAMRSDADVTVTETATRIVLHPPPRPAERGRGLLPTRRPGRRARLRRGAPPARRRPGTPSSSPSSPSASPSSPCRRSTPPASDQPQVARWVVGGHSLGGTVAVIQADDADTDPTAPAVGLLLYASYPAGDVRGSLTTAVESVSGSRDGLATPAKIDASRANLPADATFTVIEGGTHAQFGAYGPQPGDGTATISDGEARTLISSASLRFVESLAR